MLVGLSDIAGGRVFIRGPNTRHEHVLQVSVNNKARPGRWFQMLAASILMCSSIDALATVRCKKPGGEESRAIRQSFERKLLPDFAGEPAVGPLFEPCIIRHKDFGRHVLLDFSVEGFYGGNNWGLFLALGRFDDKKRVVWIGGGPAGGNAPPPYQVDAVRSDGEAWIEWHDKQCITLSYRGLAVPVGANAAFPNPRWKKVVIEHRKCGRCGEGISPDCARSVSPGGQPTGEKVSR